MTPADRAVARLARATGAPATGPHDRPRPDRLPAQPPTVPPPPPFVERRVAYRRAEDQHRPREKVLLARALDILAVGRRRRGAAGRPAPTSSPGPPARAAPRSSPTALERRAAVAVDPGEDPAAAEALAAWLDANAPRSRADRAAAGRAPISFIVGPSARTAPAVDPDATPADDRAAGAAASPRRADGADALRQPADPERRRRRPRLRVRGRGADAERLAGAPARRPSPATPPSPSPS